MINQNPFLSKTFTNIWLKHFNFGKPPYTFNFIKKLAFFKPFKLPLYVNVGRNLTKGMSYTLENHLDYKRKTFLIYDVPEYFNLPFLEDNTTSLKLKKIKQYPGYSINIDNYNNLDEFLKTTFSKSSNQKLRRYLRRLELCFDISYKMLIGPTDKAEYDRVFNHFHSLLTKRFNDKKTTNNNLNPEEWNFYKEVAYPLILEKKAGLHVVYNGNTPICIRLLYFSESIIFDAITVFDIDYTKFHIGKISIMKMLEWSFNSDYNYFDFSKGYFDYKESWSDLKYNFEYHILYDSKSITSIVIASTLSRYFKIKQFLRDKDFNKKLHNLNFILKSQNKNIQKPTIQEIDSKNIEYTSDMLVKIDFLDLEYSFLRKFVFDFLFLNSEHIKNLSVYKIEKLDQNYFLIECPKKQTIVYQQNKPAK